MKLIKVFLYVIFVLQSFVLFSQNRVKDTLIIKDIYGLRIGLDLSNPIRTIFNSNRKSLELVVDYRINKKLYAAVELGFLDKETSEDYISYTTNGQYVKIGANYNLYENWLDMENEVYIGLRYGFSAFKQTLNSYTIYSDVVLPSIQNNVPKEFSGLNANWGELVFGMKVETFNNVFLGASFSFKKMITTKEPENFKNLDVPGFNRVFLNNGGVGFNYTIAYRLSLYKKDKVEELEEKLESITE